MEAADHDEGDSQRGRARLREHLHGAEKRKPSIRDHHVSARTGKESIAKLPTVTHVFGFGPKIGLGHGVQSRFPRRRVRPWRVQRKIDPGPEAIGRLGNQNS